MLAPSGAVAASVLLQLVLHCDSRMRIKNQPLLQLLSDRAARTRPGQLRWFLRLPRQALMPPPKRLLSLRDSSIDTRLVLVPT